MNSLKGVKVLIGPSSFGVSDRLPLERLEEAGCRVIDNPYKRRLTKEELLDLLSDEVVGLVAGLELLGRDVLQKSKLKVISRCGSGLSNVDLEAAKELGIKVYSTPDAPTASVAELTIGAMFSLLRMIPQMDRDLHEGKWTRRIGVQLCGKTVVIIGFGRIGRRVVHMLRPFDVRIIVVDPNIDDNINRDGVEIFSLKEALPQADIITIHCSGEQQLIGKNEFKLIKKGAFLLNAARGGIVDEDSLVQALEGGSISRAWIDVFSVEPYSGRLQKYPQVILTPHVGSYTIECRKVMEIEAVNNLISALKGDRC